VTHRMPLFASRGTTALAAARPQPRCRVKCSWILALALATAAPAFAGSDTAPSRGACGEAAYVPGMAGFVLVSCEYDRPCAAPRSAQSDPGGARAAAPAIPAPAAVADAVFSLLTK